MYAFPRLVIDVYDSSDKFVVSTTCPRLVWWRIRCFYEMSKRISLHLRLVYDILLWATLCVYNLCDLHVRYLILLDLRLALLVWWGILCVNDLSVPSTTSHQTNRSPLWLVVWLVYDFFTTNLLTLSGSRALSNIYIALYYANLLKWLVHTKI